MATELRPCVRRFAEEMELALQQHDHDRGDEWQEENIDWLLDRLKDELDELESAYLDATDDDNDFSSTDFNEVIMEASDVGNFAMMIAANAAAMMNINYE